VAGFQGINEAGQITTLGRGGSDLTAIALRGGDQRPTSAEVYTDVDGVYTADPRVVKDAKKLEEISYDEMLELASLGSKVMQTRTVSTFAAVPGLSAMLLRRLSLGLVHGDAARRPFPCRRLLVSR